jgi:error-prone DNA polymerase
VTEEARLRERAKRYSFSLIAANEVLYHNPARRRLQDVLTAIRHGNPVASCGQRLKPNAEYGLKSPHAFAKLYGNDPVIVDRTLEIAARCTFRLDEIRYRYPSEKLPDGTTQVLFFSSSRVILKIKSW